MNCILKCYRNVAVLRIVLSYPVEISLFGKSHQMAGIAPFHKSLYLVSEGQNLLHYWHWTSIEHDCR